MTLSQEKMVDLRVKHLEMLQGAISRMAGYSTSAKGYCITLLTGIVGFCVSLKLYHALYFGFLPVFVFWMLDSQYLRLERGFRGLFDQVRTESWNSKTDFSLDIGQMTLGGIHKAAFSWSVLPFYSALAVALIATLILAGLSHGWT